MTPVFVWYPLCNYRKYLQAESQQIQIDLLVAFSGALRRTQAMEEVE